MRCVRLIAVCDQYDKAPGLAIKGTPVSADDFMADRNGDLIAHDLLEHVNGVREIGSVWDELEALGAIWQVRGRHGDLTNTSYHSVETNIASDITRMFPQWLESENKYCGPNYGKRQRPHDYDESFLACIEIARRDIPKEYGPEYGYNADLSALEEYLACALYRMRVGFRKAQRKYGDGFCGHSMYYNIREAIRDGLKGEELFEGAEFRLLYMRNEARLVPVYEEY